MNKRRGQIPDIYKSMHLLLVLISLLVGPSSGFALVIDNGSAPPNPENLFEEPIDLFGEDLIIRNAGCRTAAPCVGARAPTAIVIGGGVIANRGRLTVGGSSSLSITGGSFGTPGFSSFEVHFEDQSEGEIWAGVIWDSVLVTGAAQLEINGTAELERLSASSHPSSSTGSDDLGASIVVEAGRIANLEGNGNAVVQVRGGQVVDHVIARERALIVFSGWASASGVVPRLDTAGPGAWIEIVGHDFTLDGSPLDYGPVLREGQILSGVLSSGASFRARIGFRLSNIRIVPEATSFDDRDADGVPDFQDFCPDTPDSANLDHDLDLVGDACNEFLDSDGDDYADDLDTCPSLYNPDQLDFNDNNVGDACNDAIDLDGDEIEDDLDLCPRLATSNNTDRDFDEVGDACDPYPDDARNLGALDDARRLGDEVDFLTRERDEALGDLVECRSVPAFIDEDLDGVPDVNDRCPRSESQAQVDDGGCTLPQFCAAISTWDRSGPRRCVFADWRGDEAGTFPQDCHFEQAAGSHRVCTVSPPPVRSEWWRKYKPAGKAR